MNTIIIKNYVTRTGKEPYVEWVDELDGNTRAIIRARINRMRLGNFGDCKRIKGCKDIWELRIKYGAGYRIYYGKKKDTVVILLLGGDKGTQERDIEKAKRYWNDYGD